MFLVIFICPRDVWIVQGMVWFVSEDIKMKDQRSLFLINEMTLASTEGESLLHLASGAFQ